MDKVINVMMNLIGSEIGGVSFNEALCRDMSAEDWDKLYLYANHHDMAHLVGNAILQHSLLPEGETRTKFEKQVFTAVYRYEELNETLCRLRQIFCDGALPFIPLKGSVIRGLYPQPWFRTSCDIDILVHNEDFERACELVKKCFDAVKVYNTSHDSSFTTGNGVHLELHFTLIEQSFIGKASEPLASVWDTAAPVGDTSEHTLSDAVFYYYHLAHMAKHLTHGGGCGIRSFIDLWLMNKTATPEMKHARQELLAAGGLERFTLVASALASHWFAGGTADKTVQCLETLVLSGGTYGTRENEVVVNRVKSKSGFGFILNRLWMPYDSMSARYPVLKGRRFLLPFFEVVRWFRLLNGQVFRRSVRMLKTDLKTESRTLELTDDLLTSLGLMS